MSMHFGADLRHAPSEHQQGAGWKIVEKARETARLVRFLYQQRLRGFDGPQAPHFEDETLEFFKNKLRSCTAYLEFGSGGSTVWVDRAGIPGTSIESDRFYAKAVRRALSPSTSVRIITPDIGITKQWGWPVFAASRKGRRYVLAPFPLEPVPDLILVDGRYRVACALASAHFAKMAGSTATLIVDDYDDRPHYRKVEQLLGRPQRIGRSAVFEIGKQDVSLERVLAEATDCR